MAFRGSASAARVRLQRFAAPASNLVNKPSRNGHVNNTLFSIPPKTPQQASLLNRSFASITNQSGFCCSSSSSSSSSSSRRRSSSSRDRSRGGFSCSPHPTTALRTAAPSWLPSTLPSHRRPLSTRSEDNEGNNFSRTTTSTTTTTENTLNIHVTHVDATANKARPKDSEDGGDVDRAMMPEEDRVPLGAGAGAGAGDAAVDTGAEPPTVRFLDVPGSEQTREEKMTIVFTCTVRAAGLVVSYVGSQPPRRRLHLPIDSEQHSLGRISDRVFTPKHALRGGTSNENGGFGKISSRRLH